MRTFSLLKSELQSHRYGVTGEYGVERLFKIFSTEEIYDVEDVVEKYYEFLVVLRQLRQYAPYMSDKEFAVFESLAANNLVSYPSHIGYLVDRGIEDPDKLADEYYSSMKFVDRVNSITGHNRDFKILDVGAGAVPYSSLILSDTYDKVTAMDKFVLSEECIRRFGISARDEFLTEKTSLANYDFIVGNRPCEGIPKVVEACADQKKPYFLVLCACDAPGHALIGWQDYLRKIDGKIKFSKDSVMAYNLEM